MAYSNMIFPPVPKQVREFLEANKERTLKLETVVTWRVVDKKHNSSITFDFRSSTGNPFATP